MVNVSKFNAKFLHFSWQISAAETAADLHPLTVTLAYWLNQSYKVQGVHNLRQSVIDICVRVQ